MLKNCQKKYCIRRSNIESDYVGTKVRSSASVVLRCFVLADGNNSSLLFIEIWCNFMKITRMIFLAFLAATQLGAFVSCTAQDESESDRGAFYKMEKSGITINGFMNICNYREDIYFLSTVDELHGDYSVSLLDIKTGEIKESVYAPPLGEAPIMVCGDENGNVYVISQDSGFGRSIYKFSPEGENIGQRVYEKLSGSVALKDMYAIGDTAALVFDNGMNFIDGKSESRKEIFQNIMQSCSQRTKDCLYIYLLSHDDMMINYSITKYDAVSNRTVWSENIGHEYIYSICYDYSSGQLLYATAVSIFALNAETGKEAGSVCEFYSYIAHEGMNHLSGGENGIYFISGDFFGGEVEISALAPISLEEREKAKKMEKDKTTLVVRGFFPDSLMLRVVKEYEARYNVKIEFDYYSEKESYDTDGYIGNTNIALLSGAADWDLLMTYDLDYNLYASKNYLADLYGLGARELADSGNYFANLIKACEIDKKLYVFPLNSQFLTVYADKKKVDDIFGGGSVSWEELLEYFDHGAKGDEYLFSAKANGNEFEVLNVSHYAITNLAANVDKAMKTNQEKSDAVAEIQKNLEIFEKLYDKKYTAGDVSGRALIMDIILGSNISPDILGWDLSGVTAINMPVLSKGGEVAFTLLNGISIMNSSNNKKEAFKFLEFVSEKKLAFANSTNRSLFMEEKKSYMDIFDVGFSGSATAKKQQMEEIERLYDDLTEACENLELQYSEYGIIRFVRDETKKFLDKTLDSLQTAENIYGRAWIYYNE